MREIKFRAWIPQTPNNREGFMVIQGEPDLETLESFMHHYGGYELMQYTGLKDRTGVEVFEGDILQQPFATERLIVVYEIDRFVAKRVYDAGFFSLKYVLDNAFCVVSNLKEIQL